MTAKNVPVYRAPAVCVVRRTMYPTMAIPPAMAMAAPRWLILWLNQTKKRMARNAQA